MKQPKIENLKLDVNGTKKMRKRMTEIKKVKITINIDSDTLFELKSRAEESGSKYQTLLNQLLKEALARKTSEEKRLDRLERELERLKKKVR
jgi:predicted DNA binding CopG/RHH family protein